MARGHLPGPASPYSARSEAALPAASAPFGHASAPVVPHEVSLARVSDPGSRCCFVAARGPAYPGLRRSTPVAATGCLSASNIRVVSRWRFSIRCRFLVTRRGLLPGSGPPRPRTPGSRPATTAVHLGRDPGAVGRGGPVDGVRVPFDGSEIVFKPRRARPESATGSSLGSVVPRSCKEQNTLWLRAPLSKNSAKNTPEEGHARDKRGMTWALTR